MLPELNNPSFQPSHQRNPVRVRLLSGEGASSAVDMGKADVDKAGAVDRCIEEDMVRGAGVKQNCSMKGAMRG